MFGFSNINDGVAERAGLKEDQSEVGSQTFHFRQDDFETSLGIQAEMWSGPREAGTSGSRESAGLCVCIGEFSAGESCLSCECGEDHLRNTYSRKGNLGTEL